MFETGKIYNRRKDIHYRFGGQQQGGISTPKEHPLIFLFTGSKGNNYGYTDSWTDDGVFRYFGEGQTGDMDMERGNKAILNHSKDGKDLLLFETGGRGCKFIGQFVCEGYDIQDAPDHEGVMRKAIIFNLIPLENFGRKDDAPDFDVSHNLNDLRIAAMAAVNSTSRNPKSVIQQSYKRAAIIKKYVLARAGGNCELCGKSAPFHTKAGAPYLEPHHIRRLSDGGPDDPRFMAAICPNCHREIHYGSQGKDKNEKLRLEILSKEQAQDSQTT